MDRILIIENLDFYRNIHKINQYLSKHDFNFDVIIIKSLLPNDNNNFVNLPLGLKMCIVDYECEDIEKLFKIPFDCKFKILDDKKAIHTRHFVYCNIGDFLTNYNYKTAKIIHIKYNIIIRKCNYDYNYYRNKKYKLIKIVRGKPHLVY